MDPSRGFKRMSPKKSFNPSNKSIPSLVLPDLFQFILNLIGGQFFDISNKKKKNRKLKKIYDRRLLPGVELRGVFQEPTTYLIERRGSTIERN